MNPASQPPPVVIEHTADRVAPRLLRWMLFVSLGCVLTWMVTAIASPTMRFLLPFQALAAAAILGSLALARSGNTRAGAILFCSSLFFLAQLPPLVNGRLAVPSILLPPIIVLATGLLWSTRAALWMAGGSAASWFVSLVAIRQGLIPVTEPVRSDFEFLLILAFALVIVSAGLWVTKASLTEALGGSGRADKADLPGRVAGQGDRLPTEPLASRRTGTAASSVASPSRPEAGPGADDLEFVGKLAGGIAQDFNNLLTVVGGATELIEDDPDATDSILELAGQIRHAQERAAIVTRRLLAFAQRQVVDVRPVSVGDTVREQVEFQRHFLGPTVSLDLSVTKDDTTALTSEHDVEQLLLNLLTNARDAIDGLGWIAIRVERRVLLESLNGPAGTVPPGEYVSICVEDAGRGILPEHLGRVFEPFFSTRGQADGRGLGLSAVLGIVRRCRGQITMDTRVGRGTSVEILLPLAARPSRVVH